MTIKLHHLLSLLIVISLLCSCYPKEQSVTPQNFVPKNAEHLTAEEVKTIHTDTNYKYEYRTGTSGDYGYNYDVSGFDDEGNEVTGNVSMQDKSGNGTITTAEGEQIDVEVEWTGHGELKATDSEGNEYELSAD